MAWQDDVKESGRAERSCRNGVDPLNRAVLLLFVMGALSAAPTSADPMPFGAVDAESDCLDPVLGRPLLVDCSHGATGTRDGRAGIHLTASPVVPGGAGAGEAYGAVSFGANYLLQHAARELHVAVALSVHEALADVSGAVTDTVGPAGSNASVRAQFEAEHVGCFCVGEGETDSILVEDSGDGTYFPFRVDDDGIPATRSNEDVSFELVVRDSEGALMPPGRVEISFRVYAFAYLGGFGGIDTGSATARIDLVVRELSIRAT